MFLKDRATWRCVLADSNGPFATARSSSVHGPDASGALGGAGTGVVVTVTVTGAAGGAGAGNAVDGVAAVTVTVEAGAAGVVRPAEQPASRTTASRGSAISFMSNSHSGPDGQLSQACGRSLGDFLEKWAPDWCAGLPAAGHIVISEC